MFIECGNKSGRGSVFLKFEAIEAMEVIEDIYSGSYTRVFTSKTYFDVRPAPQEILEAAERVMQNNN